MLHYLVSWYVKCVEKVPFRKSGHIYSYIDTFNKINVTLTSKNHVVCMYLHNMQQSISCKLKEFAS